MRLDELHALHEGELGAYEHKRMDYAKAVGSEMEHEANRPAQKAAAILRLIESGPNPLNGKPHSASSAEAVVETDTEYREYLSYGREIVRRKMWAHTECEVALERAKMARVMASALAEVIA